MWLENKNVYEHPCDHGWKQKQNKTKTFVCVSCVHQSVKIRKKITILRQTYIMGWYLTGLWKNNNRHSGVW